ncbi:hypothetical protein Skr01_37190 [Sphaerisporangium krabiense]|nr:hypothetical protein Skr01_37190 [Sphaerisporangium krabiense]
MPGRFDGPNVPWGRGYRRAAPRSRAVFMDRGPGDGCRVIAHFRAKPRIREALMNGFLPYRDSTPAARVGGVRGWQADILRGES